jgi:Flp pilus assembly protein TadG
MSPRRARVRDAARHAASHAASHSRRNDDGVATLEFLALLPIALFFVLACIQLVIGVDTAQSASSAARQAARAYSLGENPRTAAENALSGSMRITQLTVGAAGYHSVTLTVAVPTFRGMPTLTVTRTAVMP